MLGKLSGWDDTIVALATPQGVGALGIVRVSGMRALNIVNELFPAKNLTAKGSHTIHVGMLRFQGIDIDQVVVSLFKAPRSYTGEDIVEITAHGSAYILERIINAIIASGARLAKPGEFTQRAFLNGKLDLTQAEAVADLINSNTEASRKNALQNVRGGFSVILKSLRDQLLTFSALIELELDFSQEDVEFADRPALNKLIADALKTVKELLSSFALGNVVKEGVQVAIVGKPNAGKSTLLNALLNEERAIVSDIPGTTRDTIEETLNINGVLFRLIDTAGIRHSKGDIIEDIGIERSRANAQKADIIIHLIDVTDKSTDEIDWPEIFGDKTLTVRNKVDQPADIDQKVIDAGDTHLYISAKTGEGLNDLKEAVYRKVMDNKGHSESTIVTNVRHYEALQKIYQSLEDIELGLNTQLPGDLLSLDIRRCLHYLGEITGEITNEDQLDYIFSKFCIGK